MVESDLLVPLSPGGNESFLQIPLEEPNCRESTKHDSRIKEMPFQLTGGKSQDVVRVEAQTADQLLLDPTELRRSLGVAVEDDVWFNPEGRSSRVRGDCLLQRSHGKRRRWWECQKGDSLAQLSEERMEVVYCFVGN
jgi:hypothetical protein